MSADSFLSVLKKKVFLSIGGTVFMIKTILFSGCYSFELKPERPL